MPSVRIYVVSRDFGFAPNPFHGICTLATCKPAIRSASKIGDWVIGVGGTRLKAQGRLVFAMEVTETLGFDAYWTDPRFVDKRPLRNGSRRMIVGDNIYHHRNDGLEWVQADSHHSLPDGKPNLSNLEKDTRVDRVLVSHNFYYFGGNAPKVPPEALAELGAINRRGSRAYHFGEADTLLRWIETFCPEANQVLGDPFDFKNSQRRYSSDTDRIVG